MIRESLWRRRYGGDPGWSAARSTIGGQPRTVVGVMPDTFEFPDAGELWLPLDELTLGGSRRRRRSPGMRVFGVLSPA